MAYPTNGDGSPYTLVEANNALEGIRRRNKALAAAGVIASYQMAVTASQYETLKTAGVSASQLTREGVIVKEEQ